MKRSFLCLLALLAAAGQARAGAREAAQSANRFGFELLEQCRRTLPQKNYFLSPPSLVLALSMVENGAAPATREEMARVLHTPESLAAVNRDNKALLAHLAALGPKIQLDIASSLWYQQGETLLPDFEAVNQNAYQAKIAGLDFGSPEAVKTINEWAGAKTKGKIPQIVQRLPPYLALIVLNAVYFRGSWETPFPTNGTTSGPFTLANGQIVHLPRMRRSGEFQYVENGAFQAVTLPYSDGDLCLDVILPKKPLGDFLAHFTAENYQSAIAQMLSTRGTLELPRFKLENDYSLNPVLQAMGMRRAFEKGAFNRITRQPLSISLVKQKTYVEVNEEGTVAAAVTGVFVRSLAVRREPPPFEMIVNRPFLAAIRERQTGLVLFLGAISDPR